MSKHEFRDELLDKDTGLGVIIHSCKFGRFVILNDTKLDICQFLEVLHGREAGESEPAVLSFRLRFIQGSCKYGIRV